MELEQSLESHYSDKSRQGLGQYERESGRTHSD